MRRPLLVKPKSTEPYYTKPVEPMQKYTYTHGRLTPNSLLQLTIDLWKTTTPNQFHISKNAHIPMAD